ncbi:MAG TPA: peptidylprolyl isomerase [Polyangiaceae bacterium]|nr:peptidylprolyl isomerase [Polyangiaceae bacterium]
MRFVKHLGWLVLFTACRDPRPAPNAQPTASAQASASPANGGRGASSTAEQRRDSAAISAEFLASRDVQVRRDAARALARIADARAAELLLLALADEDPEVNTWAAYGLGYACRGRELKTVRALVARAASLPSDERRASRLAGRGEAIADALGRCASSEAESTLRAWLHGPLPRAEAAALALGRLAVQGGKLDDLTLVALLDAADRPRDPLHNALFPLTRLAALNASSAERTRALALRSIAARAPSLEFALRALGRTGDGGYDALGTLAAQHELEPRLRAEALHELGTSGSSGQKALWAVFDSGLRSLPDDATLLSEDFGPISALIDALSTPIYGSLAQLQALAALTIAEADSATLKRRKVHLRCTAAALLAGSNYQSPRLLACDPAPDSRERALAGLRVLAREKLRGARKKAFLAATRADDSLLREAALDRLAEHPELGETYAVLADALGSKALGVVASAAHLLASYPERSARTLDESGDARSAPRPDESVIQALQGAFTTASARHSIEVQCLLLDALGALQILSLKDHANAACLSDNPSLREHAQKALRLLGEQARRCDSFEPAAPGAAIATSTSRTQLSLETDAGPLTIRFDPTFAPVAVARVLALAERGFYDGMLVHRVVPGFVAQFGDPGGDGYGGDDQPPLRCETSPIAFERGSVGVALSGRDTGSSQLFVTLGRYPHLDGEYSWLGEAGPGWERVAPGDRILHARISSVP